MKNGRITSVVKIIGIVFLAAGLAALCLSLIIGAGIAGLIPSGVFILSGFIMLLVIKTMNMKKQRLMETGVQAEGIIERVVLDHNVRVNNRHPFRAECRVTDPITGEEYLYSSPRIIQNISHLEGTAVTVYYDPDNRKKYYVDIEAAIKAAEENGHIVHDYR